MLHPIISQPFALKQELAFRVDAVSMGQFYAVLIASVDDLSSKALHVYDILWNLADLMRKDKDRSPYEFQINFLLIKIVEFCCTAFYPRVQLLELRALDIDLPDVVMET